MTRLDYEKARRRTRAADYELDFDTRHFWAPRLVKYEARCAGCGGPVLKGDTAYSAKMRKSGKWFFMHTPCYRRKSQTRV